MKVITISNKEKPIAIAMLGNSHSYSNAVASLKKLSIKKSETVLIVNEAPSYAEKGISWLGILGDEWLAVVDISYRYNNTVFKKVVHRYLKIYWAIKARNAIRRFDTSKTKVFISSHYDWESDINAYHSIGNNSKKYLVIDDGMKNIAMEALREKELNKSFPNIFNQSAYNYLPFYERLIRRVFCAALFVNTSSVRQLYWYTQLPISVFNKKNSDIFIDISEQVMKKPINENSIHYISQPIPQLTVKKKLHLRKLFESLKKNNPKSTIYYFPHRFETKCQTNLANDYFKIISPECNYEDYLQSLDSYPLTIISFYSSVLFTLHKYHEIGIEFKSLYDSNIYESNKNLELVYNAIKRSKYIHDIKADQ